MSRFFSITPRILQSDEPHFSIAHAGADRIAFCSDSHLLNVQFTDSKYFPQLVLMRIS